MLLCTACLVGKNPIDQEGMRGANNHAGFIWPKMLSKKYMQTCLLFKCILQFTRYLYLLIKTVVCWQGLEEWLLARKLCFEVLVSIFNYMVFFYKFSHLKVTAFMPLIFPYNEQAARWMVHRVHF